jgi:hypothetical protein
LNSSWLSRMERKRLVGCFSIFDKNRFNGT